MVNSDRVMTRAVNRSMKRGTRSQAQHIDIPPIRSPGSAIHTSKGADQPRSIRSADPVIRNRRYYLHTEIKSTFTVFPERRFTIAFRELWSDETT